MSNPEHPIYRRNANFPFLFPLLRLDQDAIIAVAHSEHGFNIIATVSCCRRHMSLSAETLAEFADQCLQGTRMKVVKERWLIDNALHYAQVYRLCRYYSNW